LPLYDYQVYTLHRLSTFRTLATLLLRLTLLLISPSKRLLACDTAILA
jgi:hypothetical protein